jgi:hypothetical protein
MGARLQGMWKFTVLPPCHPIPRATPPFNLISPLAPNRNGVRIVSVNQWPGPSLFGDLPGSSLFDDFPGTMHGPGTMRSSLNGRAEPRALLRPAVQ